MQLPVPLESARSPATGSPAPLEVRPLRFEWPAELPRYWYGGRVFRTHFLSALSLLFPLGEQFFIDAVRWAREEAGPLSADEELKVRAFIGQEGWHRQAHHSMNQFLARAGVPTAALEAPVAQRIRFIKERVPPLRWLAATVCLEHFTAIMAHDLLARKADLEMLHPHFRRLWTWHALEELEHKSVAFDLYRRVGGGYRMRVVTMGLVTFNFTRDVVRNLRGLMRCEPQPRWRAWAEGARFVFAYGGLFWRLLPDYLRFFGPGFHPSQIDDRALCSRAAAELAIAP